MDDVIDSIIIYTINNGTLTWLVPYSLNRIELSTLMSVSFVQYFYHSVLNLCTFKGYLRFIL